MKLYTFKPVLTDGVAPDGSFVQRMQCAKKGSFFQCVTLSCEMDRDNLRVGDEVLCSITIDEIPLEERLTTKELNWWNMVCNLIGVQKIDDITEVKQVKEEIETIRHQITVLREYFEAMESYDYLKLCEMIDGRYDSQPAFDRREKAAQACYDLFKENK